MDVTQSTGDMAASAHQTVDRLSDAAGRATENLVRGKERLSHGSAEMLESCRSYINRNPGRSVGAAVVAGFLLRHLIRRR